MIGADCVAARMARGEACCGLLNSVPSTLLCEMAGRAGYDYLILDLEHLPNDEAALVERIRACELAGVEPWVRVPDSDPKRIGRLLDAGAAAIVLPHWRLAAEVAGAVAASRFPPAGRRGISGGRPTGFGRIGLDDYVARVNDRAWIVPMIETREAVAALPEILDLDGVAAIIEGALDLALALGVGPDPGHAQVSATLRDIAARCRAAGVPFIANPRDDAQRADWTRAGIRAWLAGEDRGLLLAALQARRAAFDSA